MTAPFGLLPLSWLKGTQAKGTGQAKSRHYKDHAHLSQSLTDDAFPFFLFHHSLKDTRKASSVKDCEGREL